MAWQKAAGPNFKMVRCENCGLIYLSPRPAPDEISEYYADNYACYRPSIANETFLPMKWARLVKYQQRRKMVEKYVGQKGRVLDVGCATGLFLNEMQSAGWQSYGVEPIAYAAEYARQNFNLDVFNGFLKDAPFPAGSFDAITFWDVLEHTFSPTKEIRMAANLLKPGGVLAINIPNWNSLDRHLFGAYWIGLDPPRHLYVFDHAVLNSMLQASGFEVLEWTCFFPAYFATLSSIEICLRANPNPFSKAILKFLYFPGVRYLFQPFYTLTNWKKTSGVISVFARKVS
jgi:SAM-dependent methyltransferase